MLAYTTYTEAGGTGKTTLSANLAVAHARAGLDTLVLPLDPQDANLSRLFAIDGNRDDDGVDNLIRHMIGKPAGEFADLITTKEGVDIIPEHNSVAALGTLLEQSELPSPPTDSPTAALGGKPEWKQLHRVLLEHGVPNNYDVVICDPPATEGAQLYNAITATGALLLAVEPTPKGRDAIAGLEQLVNGLTKQLQTQIGVVGAVPVRYRDTNTQADVLDDLQYDTVTKIRERGSLFEGAWDAHCSAFRFVDEHRSRVREYEQETLAKLDRAARTLESKVGIEAPHPPEPGTLNPEHNTESLTQYTASSDTTDTTVSNSAE